MRGATARSPSPSGGSRTLIGIGPEFFGGGRAPGRGQQTLDGVPTVRMDRTPSSPIHVERPAGAIEPTVRIPIGPPARRVRRAVAAPTMQIPIDEATPAPGPPRRVDSLISAHFFEEGERQEANGWEDSPLALEPSPDERSLPFSSFDRIPRRRWPLVVTTFIVGIALVIGVAIKGPGSGAARVLLATEAGQRAAEVWNKVRTGLAFPLTRDRVVASARAMVPGAHASEPAPAPASTPAVATPAPVAAAAPAAGTVAPARREASPGRAEVPAPAPTVAHAPAEQPSMPAAAPAAPPAATPTTTPVDNRVVQAAPAIEAPANGSARRAEPARHGLVWSPAEQRLVPSAGGSSEAPATDVDGPRAATSQAPASDDKPRANTDKDVLPLDEAAHSTF